ncbi:MAG: hypothetical protein EXS08_16620 [Planctomycetes bacterium]|nr:hypothetical protein [Planctomycetota bacterium]
MKRVATGLWLAVLALAGGGALAAQDGKLDDVRDAVRDGDDHEHGDEHDHDYDDDYDWEDALFEAVEDDWFGENVGGAFAFLVLLPFRGPREGLADEGFAPARFQEYPGRRGPGYWLAPEDVHVDKRWSFRPRAELGSDFDDLERTGLALELEHENRFGLDLAWSRFREDLGAVTDELDLADANLVFRFAQGPRAAFRAGLGVNYLNDSFGEDYGFNSTYAATFLPAERVTLGFEGDLGTLGDATLRHVRASLGFVLERFELYAAYDAWGLDSAELDSFSLGLRAWF